MGRTAPAARDTERRPTDADGQRTRRRLRRGELAALATAFFVLIAGAGTWYITQGPSEVTVDQALEEFRAGTASTPAPSGQAPRATIEPSGPAPAGAAPASAPGAGGSATAVRPGAAAQSGGLARPEPGVSTFATSGYESTDALGGARHDYPEKTPITTTHAGCSWTSRWQPLRERWDETEFCERPDGTTMQVFTMYHEFFQRGVTERFECKDAYVMFTAMEPGRTWTFTCASSESKIVSRNTLVAYEDVNVGGTTVRAARIRYEITATGANEGTLLQERWLANEPRSLVRITQNAKLKVASPFGPVNYTEEYRLDLTSLTPER